MAANKSYLDRLKKTNTSNNLGNKGTTKVNNNINVSTKYEKPAAPQSKQG